YDADIITEGIEFQADNYYEPKKLPMQRRIAVVLESLRPCPGERILDVGCGVGTFAFHCARSGALSTGIDYSPESIKAATILSARFEVSGKADFVVGNALALPFENESFDKIVSADFIEHITHEEKPVLCREMLRVLKPGGIMVLFTPNKIREDIGALYWAARHRLRGDAIPFNDLHYGLISRFEFERILRKLGLKFRFKYADITRPFVPSLPLVRHLLSLNLLWVVRKQE
ncbi:MAG: class I SAM-dependent methyltransferase, partial [Endomicrobiales bacterium]